MPYARLNEPKIITPGRTDAPPKRYKVRNSKKLPEWLWLTIAKILGIPQSANDKPILANIFYYITVLSALVFVFSTLAHAVLTALFNQRQKSVIADSLNSTIRSDSEGDVFDAAITVVMTVFWCLLGLYANSLAVRLYSSNRMVDMIRLHSKTIFKINAALIFFLLLASFVIVNNVDAYFTWFSNGRPCSKIESSVLLCRIRFVSQCVFSFFTVLWNSLVGLVLLSVCRTHTMGIRRFIQDLEKEAQLYESMRFGRTAPTEDLLWLNGNDADVSSECDDESSANSAQRKRYSTITTLALTPVRLEQLLFSPIQNFSNAMKRRNSELTVELQNMTNSANGPREAPPTSPQQPMSNAVILQRYWKQSCSMRMSSITFQRWTASVTAICLTWIAINLVQWVPHSPTSLAVTQVIIPLLILPLICAAYAEVNIEGFRILKCICPMEERLKTLLVLLHSPLQLTVFGVPLTYTSMSTVALALLIALVSRVALKQIGTSL